jgi:hypothetical protein
MKAKVRVGSLAVGLKSQAFTGMGAQRYISNIEGANRSPRCITDCGSPIRLASAPGLPAAGRLW